MSIIPPERRALYLELLEAFRYMQRGTRFMSNAREMTFGLSGSHIIAELDSESPPGIGELSAMLQIDRSSISRVLSTLERAGMLSSKASPDDARRRIFEISPKGRKRLDEFDSQVNERYQIMIDRLGPQDGSRFLSFLRMLADGTGALPGITRAADHLIRPQMRRVTRSLGFMANSFMDSGISSSQWQLLSELEMQKEAATVKTLSLALRVTHNTMSTNVSRLEEAQLLKKHKNPADRRSAHLVLTAAGRAALEKVRDGAALLLDQGLRGLSAEELRDFVRLALTFAGGEQLDDSRILMPQIQIRRLKSTEDRQQARGFILFQLVSLNRHMFAPATVVGKDSVVYGALEDGRLTGVCELEWRGKALAVQHFFMTDVSGGAALSERFLGSVLQDLSRTESVRSFLVPESCPFSPELVQLLQRSGCDLQVSA